MAPRTRGDRDAGTVWNVIVSPTKLFAAPAP